MDIGAYFAQSESFSNLIVLFCWIKAWRALIYDLAEKYP